MKTVRMRTAVALSVLAVFPGPVAAQEDSTSVQEVDVPWQAPSYATTSGYANNAGQLGGQGLDWVRNNGLYSSNAGSVNASGITGIASCASGYALKKVAGGFTCVNQVSGADVAASVDASGITGIASCASGYALSKVDGGFTCVNDAGGGSGGGTTIGGCSDAVTLRNGSIWNVTTTWPCWGTATVVSAWVYGTEPGTVDYSRNTAGYCTKGRMVNCDYILTKELLQTRSEFAGVSVPDSSDGKYCQISDGWAYYKHSSFVCAQ